LQGQEGEEEEGVEGEDREVEEVDGLDEECMMAKRCTYGGDDDGHDTCL